MAKKNLTEVEKMFKEELEKLWGKNVSMVDYCMKEDTPYQTPSGKLFFIPKLKIETCFCFGYSTLGQGPTYEECQETYRDALNDIENYFIQENLNSAKDELGSLDGDYVWIPRYSHSNSILMFVSRRAYDEHFYNGVPVGDVTEEDKAFIRGVHKDFLEKFEKRLRAYYKRYGDSKISTWTYWMDE